MVCMLMVSVSHTEIQGSMSGHLQVAMHHISILKALVRVQGMVHLNQILWPITISARPGGNFGTSVDYKLYDTPLWSTTIGDCDRSDYDVPYFCAKLPEATTENLELHVCTSEVQSNEDIQIESINIYVR